MSQLSDQRASACLSFGIVACTCCCGPSADGSWCQTLKGSLNPAIYTLNSTDDGHRLISSELFPGLPRVNCRAELQEPAKDLDLNLREVFRDVLPCAVRWAETISASHAAVAEVAGVADSLTRRSQCPVVAAWWHDPGAGLRCLVALGSRASSLPTLH